MQKLLATLLCSAVAIFPLPSFATFQCQATVKTVLVYGDGSINVLQSGRGDYTYVCKLDGSYGGVSPTTCASWMALLEAIKKKGGTAEFYYAGTGSCATLPTYSNSPAPVYIGDVTP